MRPIDPTRFYTPAPHQNRRFADPVEKVGLGSPTDFEGLLGNETEKWRKVVEFAGIKRE